MQWRYKETDKEKAKNISDVLSIPLVVSKLLVKRGYDDPYKADSFLNPSWENSFHDPYLLKDIEKAGNRIINALKHDEIIAVYGDYDADGITASAILFNFFRIVRSTTKFKPLTTFFLPDRIGDGYGLQPEGLEKCISKNADLIVTVDNGISSHDSAKIAKEKGVDLIITDHHQPSDTLPEAYAIVNPKQPECSYPFKDLTGAGIAFKLALVIGNEILPQEINEKFKKRFIDLVAIGTYQDVAPLVDENRFFVKEGMDVISKLVFNNLPTTIPGLKDLITEAGYQNQAVNDYTLGFIIGPRINAGGRINTPKKAFRLLTTTDAKESRELAAEIEKINKDRQNMKKSSFDEAVRMIEMRKIFNDPVIIIASETWHKGIIGLIAGDLKEKYNKPVIVLSSMNDKDFYTASCRSIDGFNITKAISECHNLLERYGGHEKAAGFTIHRNNLSEFRDIIFNYTSSYLQEHPAEKVHNIDEIISLNDVSTEFFKVLYKFIPFGEGNPKPLFGFKKAQLVSLRKSTRGKDTIFVILQNGKMYEIPAFENINIFNSYKAGDIVDLVVSVMSDKKSHDAMKLKFVDMLSE